MASAGSTHGRACDCRIRSAGRESPRRGLAPPSNVIKAAEPGGAPVLEAPPEQECSPQERGLTCAVPVRIPAAVHPQGLLPVLPNRFPAAAGSGSAAPAAGSNPARRRKWDTLSTRTVKIDQCQHQSAPSHTSLGWEQTSWRREEENKF